MVTLPGDGCDRLYRLSFPPTSTCTRTVLPRAGQVSMVRMPRIPKPAGVFAIISAHASPLPHRLRSCLTSTDVGRSSRGGICGIAPELRPTRIHAPTFETFFAIPTLLSPILLPPGIMYYSHTGGRPPQPSGRDSCSRSTPATERAPLSQRMSRPTAPTHPPRSGRPQASVLLDATPQLRHAACHVPARPATTGGPKAGQRSCTAMCAASSSPR